MLDPEADGEDEQIVGLGATTMASRGSVEALPKGHLSNRRTVEFEVRDPRDDVEALPVLETQVREAFVDRGDDVARHSSTPIQNGEIGAGARRSRPRPVVDVRVKVALVAVALERERIALLLEDADVDLEVRE